MKNKTQEVLAEDVVVKKVHKEDKEDQACQKTDKGESPKKEVAPSLFNTSLPTTEKTPSLFGNLFAGTAPPTQSSLFTGSLFTNNSSTGDNKPATGGFFQNLNSVSNPLNFQSLFNNNNQAGEKEEGKEESEDEKPEPSPEVDPAQSSANYQYEEKYNKLASCGVIKCKVGDQEAYEQGHVSVEENKETSAATFFYRTTLKRILFQGQLIPQLIAHRALGKTDDALQLLAFSKEEEKLKKHLIKIKFTKKEDCVSFSKTLQSLAEKESKTEA